VLEPSWTYLSDLVRGLYPGTPELDPQPMKGGASTRLFFRILLGSERMSAVAMFVPGAPTHEIHKDRGQGRWPFIEVRELLSERGMRVPKIFADGTEQGWLVVEDLGDDTVANYLLRRPGDKRDIYRLAVSDLARAQRQLRALPDTSIIRSRAFDRDLLRWEIDHFLEWVIVARGIPISGEDRFAFQVIAGKLANKIAAWPRGFVHRDYQSRNLMVVRRDAGSDDTVGGGTDGIELAWIDFQDAMLGPRVYDLVALLSDSYQEFDARFIEERMAEYAEGVGLSLGERSVLRREFDYVTVQRKLKDAGRFIFIERTHQNPSFLPFVGPTIEKARAAIARLSDDQDMRELGALLDRVLG